MRNRKHNTPVESQQFKVPDTSKVELFLAGIKALVAAVPFAGGSLAEIIGYCGQRYTSDRQKRVLEDVIHQLEELSTQIDDLPATLAGNQVFFTTLSYALSALQRTADEDKIVALRNAIVNSATPSAPDEALQHTFVRYVDELTAWHLILLDCICDRLAWAEKRGYPVLDTNISPVALFEGATRGQFQPPDFHKVLLQDLLTRGLATTGVDPYGSLYPRGVEDVKPRITDLGSQFLVFITPPPFGASTTVPNDVTD